MMGFLLWLCPRLRFFLHDWRLEEVGPGDSIMRRIGRLAAEQDRENIRVIITRQFHKPQI